MAQNITATDFCVLHKLPMCKCPCFVFFTLVNVCIPGSTNVGEQLPTGQLSVVPWRRTGVKYTNNEAYFDVVEEIDAIIDKSGTSLNSLLVKHLTV